MALDQKEKGELNTSSNIQTDTQPNTQYIQALEPISMKRKVLKIVENIIFTIIALLAIAFTIFTLANTNNSTISSGVSILGVDVSRLDKTAATDKVSAHIRNSLENDIILKHNDFESNIGIEQIEASFNIPDSIDAAFKVGSGSNIFSNSFKKLTLIFNPVDINPVLSLNKSQLESTLGDISTQLPDAVKEGNYYIEDNNLIVTPGKDGVVIDIPEMTNTIISKINDLSFVDEPIEIATIDKIPEKVDIEKVYNEVHKEASDAHFNAETHVVYPEENGLDFNMSLDEAKELVSKTEDECTIPLKVLHPNITTKMLGMEAFPDWLSSFSTRYPASNRGRTTNLKLAAGKINGTVLLPGETFSYNTTVGQRTIAAGYQEAQIYQDGQVVNGLGGGVCQISTTLYNAALYANLQILERRNHQFVPSYVGAGRDATVVYGSQDFKFKNNKKYAIKIVCSVEGGIAKFDIYGVREPNDYEVVITAGITSRSSKSFTSATYKTLKRNGQIVSKETISRDTYKSH